MTKIVKQIDTNDKIGRPALSIEDFIFEALDRIADRDTRSEDSFREDRSLIPIFNISSKANSLLLGKLLEVIADRLEVLQDQIGADRIVQALEDLATGKLSAATKEILKENYRRLAARTPSLLPDVDTSDVSAWPGSPFWNGFLLLLGISPEYGDLLTKYFGDNGLASVAVLLKSIVDGELDPSIIFNFVPEEELE